MLEQLFGSKTRARLLKAFFMKPDKAFFVRELSRTIDAQINAVRRELELLLKIGIIKVEDKPSQETVESNAKSGASLRKYYRIDTESIIYSEMHALVLKEKVLGEQQFVKDIEKKGGDISLLILTGAFTGRSDVDTDVLIVGELKERNLSKLMIQYETEFGFEIRYTTMTTQEFVDRRYVMDKFLYSIFDGKHHKVVNTLGA